MILTAHQPVYLPWLGLFHKIALAETFVYFDQVQYLPKDWMNRNKIRTKSGSIWLTVPVLRKGYRDLKTSEIEINNSIDWQKKHFRSISLNYKKSPYFENYIPFFEDVYSRKWKFLGELNEYMLKWFLDELGIKVNFLNANDFKFQGEKSSLILNMCKELNASTYIFGMLGKDYADVQEFEKNNIGLIFQNYNHPKYSQLYREFISHMSVIDLLFNHGPKSLEIILSNNISQKSIIS
jgi:hypothetical protein|tara:strand:+ start:393 stop:1103 length:711 start_codon:yes stop_codon:yes gene_type:complete